MISRFLFFLGILFFFISSSGQDFIVSKIRVSGNEKTKRRVVLRELVVEEDSTYSISEIDYLLHQSKNRLLNMNLFNRVEIDTLHKGSPNKLIIEISLIEKHYLWPIPVIEFSDRNFNVWSDLNFSPDRTNYGLYLFKYNAFGLNHTLKTSIIYGYNKKLGVEYRIPFINQKTNWGASFIADYHAQNEVWYETVNDSLQFFNNGLKDLIKTSRVSASFTNRFRNYTTAKIDLVFENSLLDASVPRSDFFLDEQYVQQYNSTSASLVYDTRDNIFFPVTGSYVEPTIGLESISNSFTLVNGFAKLKAQYFKKLKPKLSGAASMYVKYNDRNLPYTKRRILGYEEIIRGFEHYVIEGKYGWKSNMALRHLTYQNRAIPLKFIPYENYNFLPLTVYTEVFWDQGMVTAPLLSPVNLLPNTYLWSGGIGLNALFYNDRVLRLEYSYNSLGNFGFNIHFKKAI